MTKEIYEALKINLNSYKDNFLLPFKYNLYSNNFHINPRYYLVKIFPLKFWLYCNAIYNSNSNIFSIIKSLKTSLSIIVNS